MRIVLTVVIVLALVVVTAALLLRRRETHAPAGVLVDSLQAGIRAATLYFAAPDGRELIAEARELAEPGTLHDRVDLLMRELDLGPRGSGVAALPAGTALRAVYLDERGLLTLEGSRAFQPGLRGGSTPQ